MPATLKSRLPEITVEMRVRVSTAVKESAERIALDASGRAPVRTGALADSIQTRRTGGAEYEVFSDLFYSRFVENGVESSAIGPQPPRPFLLPAAEAERPYIDARVTAVLRGL